MDDDVAKRLRIAAELHDQGRLAEAGALYENVLVAAPDHAEAMGRLGALALQAGQNERAAELLGRAVGQGGGSAQTHNHLGIALRRLGRNGDAIASYDTALSLRPDYPEALNNRGNALLDTLSPARALENFDAALALRPNAGEWHSNRGLALLDLARTSEALESFDRAIALKPRYAAGHFNRGQALGRLDRLDEALASYDAAIGLWADYAKAHNNRAEILVRLKRSDLALAGYDTALAFDPADPEIHSNRGELLRRMGRLEEAVESLEAALAQRPDYPDARFQRSLIRLAQGGFAEGWRDYEQRWRCASFLKTADAGPELRSRLDPELSPKDLTGRRVLVVAEQGIGDVLMFASMLPDLIAAAADVTLVCQRRLHRLFEATFPRLALRDDAAGAPRMEAFDHILPIGSLGRLYRNRPADFPGRPYLTATPRTRDRWARALGSKTTSLRIGISWRGGTATTGRDDRSLPLAALGPILALQGCEAVSLQYGDPRPEIAALNATLPRPIRVFAPEEIADFDDLAGLVQNLDAVVSVQTAVVHLAGAVGTPGLVMIPQVAEWRYGATGSSMPWYGSIRLIRQGVDRDWAPVIQDARDRLQAMA